MQEEDLKTETAACMTTTVYLRRLDDKEVENMVRARVQQVYHSEATVHLTEENYKTSGVDIRPMEVLKDA